MRVILLSIFLTTLHADLKYSKAFDICFSATNLTTQDMLNCTYSEVNYQDRRLNQNYKKAVKLIRQEKQDELKKVQRLWISYRDAKCDFYFDLSGGTMDILTRADCILETTITRANELESLNN